MSDAQLTQVLYPRYKLLKYPACLFFLQACFWSDELEQLTVTAVLHDEVEFRLGLYDFVELNDVRVPHYLQDMDLPGDPFDVIHILDLRFL